MRGKSYVSIVGLVVTLSSVDIGIADAAKVRPPGASASREALLVYCRRQLFLKYGQRGRFGKRWLHRDTLVRWTDYCVANGGKVI
jgi:hypothetical protein